MAKALNVSLSVTADTAQARQQLQQLQQSLTQLSSTSANLQIGLSKSELQGISQEVVKLQAHLKNATNVNTGVLDFTKLNNSIKNSGTSLEAYGQKLLRLGPSGQQAFAQLAQSVAKSEIPIKRLSGLLGNMGTVLANTIRWQLSSSMIHGFMSAIQTAYRYAQDLNKSLNNIQIVTQMSDTQMGKFAVSANKAAKALSTTTTSYTDAALIYYQQGIRNEKEITERTNTTIKMANVTGQSAQEVSNQMTAIWNNFAKGGENLEYYADVITALGAATASSSAEISTGLQKFAAVADTVGLSYENATAALATITATTRQSADSVGTGLRTVFSRLQSLNLGETLDDGVTLTKYSKAMQKIGVDVLDATGNLRAMDDILMDMGEKWQDLTDAQKTATAQTIGGVRQYTTIMALMENFDFYKENLDVAKNSEGTLQKQQEIYEKSWAAAAKRVKASAETIYSSLINDQFFTQLTSGFAKFLDILNNIIVGLGGMKGLLLGIGGALGHVFSGQIASRVYNFGAGIKGLFTTPKQQAAERDRFITNASRMMAGGTYDPNTKTVIPASGNTAQDLASSYALQLRRQQDFAKNADFMTPEQRDAAQRALDNQTKSHEAYNKAKTEYSTSLDKLDSSKGQMYDIASSHWTNGILKTGGYNKIRTDFETAAQNKFNDEQLITGLRDNTISGKTLTQDQINRLNSLANTVKTPGEPTLKFRSDFTDAEMSNFLRRANLGSESQMSASRRAFREKMSGEDYQVDEDTMNTYMRDYENKLRVEGKVKSTKEQKDQDDETAKQLTKETSKGMRAAQGITNAASGMMSAVAASQQLDQLGNTINQANAGLLSTKDTVTQITSGIAGIGMNGAMAFQSMSAAAKAFGIESSAALGIWGIALTAIVMLLPSIVEGLDGIWTTPEEEMEQMQSHVDAANQDALDAREAYNTMLSDFSGHNTLLEQLNELTAGTNEFKAALLEANAEARNLINKYDLSENDYWTDKNGAIHINKEAQTRLEDEALKEAERKETLAQAAEFNKDMVQYQQDKKILDSISTREQDYANYVAQNTDEYGNFYGMSQDAWLENKFQNTAKRNGYRNYQALLDSYDANANEVNAQVLGKSGVTKAYHDLLETNAKNDDGKVTDLEKLVNSSMEKNFNPENYQVTRSDLQNTSWTSWFAGHDLNYFEEEYKKLNEEAYQQLIESSEYQGMSRKQKKEKLQGLIQNENTLQKMQEDYDSKQEQYQTINLKKYENYRKQKGSQLKELKKQSEEDGDIGQELMDGILQDYGRAAADLQKVIIAQTDLGTSSTDLAKTMEDYSIEDIETITQYGKQFGQMFGKQASGFIITQLSQDLKNNNHDLVDVLDTIDWSDSNINNLFNLEEVSKNLKSGQTYLQQEMSSLITNIKKDIGGDAGLLQELYSSEDFANTLEGFKESFEETGEIGADSILGAAKSCKTLSKFLDIADVNAQGLADIFESIEIGDIGIEEVTDGLLQAMSAAGALEANLAEVYEHIDSFKLDRSISDIGKFYKGLADQVESSQGAGMLFDKPLLQSWKELFGDNSVQAYKDWARMATDQKNWTPEEISDNFNEKFAAEIAAMQSIQERGNLSGMFEYAFNRAGQTNNGKISNFKSNEGINYDTWANEAGQISTMWEGAESALMHFDETTGQVVTDNDEAFQSMFSSQAEFIDYLANNLNIPEDMAEAMAAEFAATDVWAHDVWGVDAAQAGYDKLKSTLENGNDLTAAELKAFYNQYSDVISKMEGFEDVKSFDDFAAHFRKDTKDMGGSLIDLGKNFDYAKATYEDLKTAMSDQEGEEGLQAYLDKNTKKYTSDLAHTRAEAESGGPGTAHESSYGSLRDVKELQEAYMGLGFTASQANALIDESGQALVGQARNLDGTIRTITEQDAAYQEYLTKNALEHSAANMQAYIESTEEAAQTAQTASAFADAFKAAFEGEPIKITYENGEIPEVPDTEATVNYTGNFDNIGTPPTLSGTVTYTDNGPGPGCFIGESKILMANKTYKNIKDINIGDIVISYNENNNKFEIDEVTEFFIHSQINTLVIIQYDNNTSITMTLGHPLLSTKGWKSLDPITSLTVHNVNATLLNIGDSFISYKNEEIKVINIEIISNLEKVYNFSTRFNHTYIVNNIIAHNKYTGYHNNRTPDTGFEEGLKAGEYQGWANLGEQGEELWIHDGVPYLAGIHGPTQGFIHKDDIVYTHPQTQKILADNPSLEDIPGFSVGYHKVTWGKSGGANAGNAKTSKYDPERYHLITRQLKDLQREYDRLNKLKENCYGTNKLEAIQREIDATDELIKGQKELVKQAEDYLKIDAGRLKGLLEPGEFQVDENGNLLNFEELQEKYRKKAEEDKDEDAQDIWKALQQYEETVDKLQEANVEMQDLLYQEMELRLEKVTTKAELKIDFDEREIKLLDHYIKRIDDNIYHTAEVLALTEQKLGHINQKIEDTKEGINGLFTELSDSQGNKITKEDGSNYTLEDWLAMSKEERDQLDINDEFGKQLEEYMDNLLDYIEELEEFKTKGVEEFSDAFSELNDNVRSSIDLFNHYNQLLSSLKNITQLQGVKLSAEMKAAMKEIDAVMFNNTQNNIDAEKENYRRLSANVADLRKKVAETTDETLKKQWEEQLKTAEEELRTSQTNLLSLWETGLQQAKDMFETALEEAATAYEEEIAGMYGTTDELQKAWDQQKKNDEFYVKDYEKYYQISKLQRSITKDLEAAAKNGNKQNKNLKKLYDELNNARENGVELSAYDLDIFEKRYEYEKALMDLEDARNAKSTVRLQRDANGNWGYVYTNNADDDELIAKQQAVDDKFYELQKATQERVAALSDDMMSEVTGVGRRLQELRSSGASQETIDKYLEQERKYLDNYRGGLAKALADAGMTEEEARTRYGNEGFDILDQFGESLLSAITGGNETLDEFFDRVGITMEGTNEQMGQASQDYQDNIDAINKWFNESGEDLAKVIKGFASVIDSESEGNLIDSKEQIQNAKDTFDEILKVATDFEKKFLEIYQPIIDENEKLVADLLYALHALNREEYTGPDHKGDSNYGIGAMAEGAEPIKPEGEGQSSGSDQPYISPETETPETETSETETSETEDGVIYTYQTYRYVKVGGGHHQVYIVKMAYYRSGRTEKLSETKGWVEACTFVTGGAGSVCTKCGQMKVWSGEGDKWIYFDSGGYTGEWGSAGRLAMLHEKELVLNKNDTQNFLDATQILRTIDLQASAFSAGLGNIITPWISDLADEVLEQNVHIEASFPNATNHSEIEEAFNNLVNRAAQYANRKNMT